MRFALIVPIAIFFTLFWQVAVADYCWCYSDGNEDKFDKACTKKTCDSFSNDLCELTETGKYCLCGAGRDAGNAFKARADHASKCCYAGKCY